ncbi:ElaA protein [Chitinophaga skermanii]|uniref:ElaA protein n=1 Tax=Chitinophaga skermanii TaxID=331697 RepID=A0A327R356_9BACT|nr:GNAT family N-acetyltransferase [Chitinophaga skermanii]RAJ10655.1 ElaA protein [Chitinophaga skermanii]
MKITWFVKKFEDLGVHELYDLLRLRSEVFVVEQNCVYLDLDNSDQKALHVLGYTDDNQLVAVTRLFDSGIKFKEASIGRVATAFSVRKLGIGKELMRVSIASVEEHFEAKEIRIGAQEYLQRFYEELGFVKASDMYLEDNIPHIEMVRVAP